MELPYGNSVEENYEYDSSEALDCSGLSSVANSNYADDELEDEETYTLEEGTLFIFTCENDCASSRQCSSFPVELISIILLTLLVSKHGHWSRFGFLSPSV